MAPTTSYNDAPKRKRSKKKKSRTEIEISSSDESDGESKRLDTPEITVKKSKTVEDTSAAQSTKKAKKEKKPKTAAPAAEIAQETPDVSMVDAPNLTPSNNQELSPQVAKAKTPPQEDPFASIYLQKITGELADDLDKVRGANDFTNRSLPMLIHALRQGVTGFDAGERRRVVEAAMAK